MKKMMLINPHPPGRHGEESLKVIVQMPLNLAYIAALTPGDWEFDVIDENIELALDENDNLTFDNVDLVCMTSVTYQSPRTYKIAKVCKEKGMPVILGGVHATTHAEEACQYVDTIFTGEAEAIWATVIEDFENGNLKARYDGGLPDLKILKNVYPDRELMRRKYDYKFSSIITTKGCPNFCDFCSVPIYQGRKFRERPFEHVLDEMEATDYKGLMLAEDNFYGHGNRSNERARNLFKGMVDRDIKKDWFGFTALNISQDPVMLEYMAKSGGFGMLIGIESTNEEVLKKMGKSVNLKMGTDSYKDSIDKIHQQGLAVWGSMVFGADGDGKDSFKRMTDFVLENNIDIVTFGIDCPFPKTQLYKRLDEEKRIFRKNYPDDWHYFDSGHLVHRLVDMTLDDFIDGMQYVYDNLYAGDNLRKRLRNSLRTMGSYNNGKRNSMFAFRVGCDWDNVFKQALTNLRELRESGDYTKDFYS